jgi:hypothetical protein
MPSDRPPFIASQGLWWLDCSRSEQQACFDPERLWSLARSEDERKKRKSPIVIHGRTSETRYWRWVNHGDDGSGNVTGATAARQRCEFLADMSKKRLCVTVDAGQGKTKALEQAQYLRQSGPNRDCLALLVQFSDLPTSKNLFLGNHPELADDPEKTPLLIRALQNSPATAHLRGREAWALLTRLIRLGRFTLLVDSLDQSARCKDADASCVALRDFLRNKPEVRCIVSGRPYAVQWHWKALFESTGDGDVWQFAMVDPFTPDEAKLFLGEQRYGLLERLQADVISIPRALEMTLTIPEDELPQIRTKSEVYLKSLEGMLNKAFEEMPATVGLERDKAWKLFALLAFEMLRQGYRAGQANAGVDPGRKDEFLKEFWRSQQKQLRSRPLLISSEDDLDRRLEDLLSANENLVNPVLAWRGERRTVVHFYWRNQTLMDMFGALWITRYAEQGHEYDWFHKQLDKEESREVCQLATEMALDRPPSMKLADANSRYIRAMRVIYEDGVAGTEEAADRPRRRWTEWIYRSWPNLLQAAGYLKKRTWEDRDLFAATIRAQEEAWGRVAVVDSNPARELVLRFLGEFPKMCADHSSAAGPSPGS